MSSAHARKGYFCDYCLSLLVCGWLVLYFRQVNWQVCHCQQGDSWMDRWCSCSWRMCNFVEQETMHTDTGGCIEGISMSPNIYDTGHGGYWLGWFLNRCATASHMGRLVQVVGRLVVQQLCGFICCWKDFFFFFFFKPKLQVDKWAGTFVCKQPIPWCLWS